MRTTRSRKPRRRLVAAGKAAAVAGAVGAAGAIAVRARRNRAASRQRGGDRHE